MKENRTQKAIHKFDRALKKLVDNHRGEDLPYCAIVGCLNMTAHDLSNEACELPVNGDALSEKILAGF